MLKDSAHFTEEGKNSGEKVESHLHNCFYDVAAAGGLRSAEATFLISFDLVRMNTSLMNVQIQKKSELHVRRKFA